MSKRARAAYFAAAVGIVASSILAGCGHEAAPATGGLASHERGLSGVPQDGFPSWAERVVLLWTNRARADPQTELAACQNCAEKACYQPAEPVRYSRPNNRAARFHAANLSLSGKPLQHDSPCTLVTDIGTQYDPGPCDGSPSCACVGGTAQCSPACTPWNSRVSMFGGSVWAENAAMSGYGDPVDVFYLWLYEGDSDPTCGWRMSNGHRANILGGASGLGVGNYHSHWTQDFGGPETDQGKIVVGAHFPETGTVALRAHWSDGTPAPTQAMVNIDGTCHVMTKERGVSPGNATYLLDDQNLPGCHHYFFLFKDSGGAIHTYPEDGSYGIGCGADWESTRPQTGPGCNCTPSCTGKQCGPDGCGGSCGDCQGGTCNAQGQCVAADDAGHDTGNADAGVADAGTVQDSGSDVDSGTAGDSGSTSDSGPLADAGNPLDAGVESDSGIAADSGPRDASHADVWSSHDSGLEKDTGSEKDAGKATDTGGSVPDDAGEEPDDAGEKTPPAEETLQGCSCNVVGVERTGPRSLPAH
ncbi:MAG: hypothetical protein HY897_14690 [Deltaproteobacteria bacterium]|nr:hypothetical protein [Deltaproteobacteria bacterium]